MKIPKLFLFVLLLVRCTTAINAQNPLERLVQQSGISSVILSIEGERIASNNYDSYLKNYVLFRDNGTASRQVLSDHPEKIELEIPSPKGNLTLELVKQSIVSPDYRVESSSGTITIEEQIGVHYRGIVKGETGSLAGASFFDGSISILASTKTLGNLSINKLENEDKYISFFDADLKVENGFECHTEDPVEIPEFLQNQRLQESVERGGGPCVRIHIEADYGLYSNKGGVVGTATYIESFFNQVAILYANEEINTVISYVHVWDLPDPFTGGSSSDAIDNFQRYILQGAALNGDLGHLVALDDGGLGGIARGIDVLCLNDDSRLAYSDINANFSNVPNFSWTVQVFTHEMGHNLGSPHTHGCYWNDNGTQIDDCGNYDRGTNIEGGPCYDENNPIIPSVVVGGTIMSYCHLNSAGTRINFANGFGPQPGDLIRSLYNGASCLSECPIGSCGVPYQLNISNISSTEATISWYHSTESNFEVRYGYDGNFTTINTTGLSVTLTGLESGKKYEVSVKTLCANESSDFVNEAFSSVCDAVFSLPYVELFEGNTWEVNSYLLDPCWSSEISDAGYGWSVEQLGTNSANTGPSGDHTTSVGKYVYAEASLGENGDASGLISPSIDLGSAAAPFATFWYHLYGETVSSLEIEITKNDGASWSSLQVFSGAQQTSSDGFWKQSFLSLANYEGETIRLKFTATRGSSFAGDIAIDDVIITDSSLFDVAVSNVLAPQSDCGLSAEETVIVSILNTGYQTLEANTTIGLELKLNNTTVTTETLTLAAALAPGDVVNYSFTETIDLVTPGEYGVSVKANLASDGIDGNNSRSRNVVNKPIVSNFPYVQSFENGSDWTSGGGENSWALGIPAKTIISGASDGDNAWVTGGLGLDTYNADEESYIEGPCFDFSNLTEIEIEFDIWWEIETYWEGATFQYSTNAGVSWITLGKASDADWFNADTITTLPGIDGWSGTDDGDDLFEGSGGWTTVKHNLEGLDRYPQVFFRVLFKSDGFVAFDGVAIDNIKITGTEVADPCYGELITLASCDPKKAGYLVEILKDQSDCDSIITTLTSYVPVIADLDFIVNDFTAIFTNNSSSATSYMWDFGDGNTSTAENPSHVYASGGSYQVKLTANAPDCKSEVIQKTVRIIVSSVNVISFLNEVMLYPNPSDGNFVLELKGESKYQELTISLLDVRGRMLAERSAVFSGYINEAYQLDALSNGVYFLRIQSNDEITTLKINILK